ncbi:DUF2252 domain-containing protein [Paenibacillus caseinilyticus]|uniref:DUF2252 domain-containing protein n=1 Tax=Paenibacillus mucilaginosus K02 TaxID=997761 RepID=I0BUY7_9BACL|nr:DUF2252 family protein [Paenibacillus mucilaginosus]AFH66184.1 hypothetical protein B2K_36745 [Paenibacillus mucilaginosus K02]
MSTHTLTERVRVTQKRLRKEMLASVLNEFDGSLMGLPEDKRRQKYAKMAGSPFSFYRGSAYLFYFDVSREWFPYHTDPARPTWIQGDLHFENFGAFRSENGRMVYDVNDFDEGCLGSYLYDLLRMSVSTALVCRTLEIDPAGQREAITHYLASYAKQIRRFARRKEDPRTLVFDKEHTGGAIRRLLKKTEKRLASHFLEGVTTLTRDTRKFTKSEEILPPTPEEKAALETAWPQYLQTLQAKGIKPEGYYRIKDLAVKHGSGTASIGLDRFYVLIDGEAGEQGLDDIVLEVKEVRAPVPAYFVARNDAFWEHMGHQGKRVILTQQAMHHEADPFLGYLTMGGRDFYVRERSPYKKRLKSDRLEGPDELHGVLKTMGQITAKLHARADADMHQGLMAYHSEDEIDRAIGGDREAFCDYIAQWAVAYAYQVEEDYALFLEWLEERRGDGAQERT